MLVAAEDIAGVDFGLNIVEAGVVAVGYDALAALFELFEVVYYAAAEEGAAVFKCGLVDDNLGTFGFYALHDSLNGTLAEVVGVALHGEAVDTYHAVALEVLIV